MGRDCVAPKRKKVVKTPQSHKVASDLPNHIKLVRGNGNNNHSSSSISSRSGTSFTPLSMGSNNAVQSVFPSIGAAPVSPSSLSLFFRPRFPTSQLPTTSTSSPTYGKANEPEEVYSTKLISAMALSENVSFRPEDFLLVSDSWKQDWERGVQVPASDSLLNPVYREVKRSAPSNTFLMPKTYITVGNEMLNKSNEPSNPSLASSLNPLARALKAPISEVERNALANPLHLHYWGHTEPAYDLDGLGRQWLALRNKTLSTGSLSAAIKCLNRADAKPKSAKKRAADGASKLSRHPQSSRELGASETERVFDSCERSCAEWLLSRARASGCLGIEFDESTVCDVCKSPISEECNEIIFCDGCNLCVHQACYGVSEIPSDVWYCSPCQQRVPLRSTDDSGSAHGSRSSSPKSRSSLRPSDSITLFPVPNFAPDRKHQRQQSRPSEPASEDAPCCILCGFAGGALKQLDASFNDALKRKWKAASIAVSSLDAHKRDLISAASGAVSSLTASASDASSKHTAKNQTFWAHVACVLWLPECRFGDPSKMEPVLQIEDIPPWRFKLTCVVCERCVGACISCCVSGCRAVFHVSCASRQHYVMRTLLLSRSDDVKLMAYCEKHSKWRRELHQLQERAAVSLRPNSSLPDSSKHSNNNYRRLKAVECRIDDGVEILEFDGNEAQYNKLFLEEDSRPDLFPTTNEDEKPPNLPFFCCTNGLQLSSLPTSTQNLEDKLRTLSLDFHKCLPLPGADAMAKQLDVSDADLNAISSFWALKRRAMSAESTPLLPYPPLTVAVRMAGSALGGVGSSAAARRMSRLAFRLLYLVHLRRHIERVRNMCYLMVRRERMRKRFLCLKRSVLDSQLKFSREHLPASTKTAPVKQLTPPSSPTDGFKKPFPPAALKRLNSFHSLGPHVRSPSISDLESLFPSHLVAASSSGSTIYENWAAFREALATYRSRMSTRANDSKLGEEHLASSAIDSCIAFHSSMAPLGDNDESPERVSEITPEPSTSSCSSAAYGIRRGSSSSDSVVTPAGVGVQSARKRKQSQSSSSKPKTPRKRKAHDENRPLQHSPLPTPPRSRTSSASSASTSEDLTVSDSGSVREQRERPASSAHKQQPHTSQPSAKQNKPSAPKRTKKTINPAAKRPKSSSNASTAERSKVVASLQREELAFLQQKRAELLTKVKKHLRLNKDSHHPSKPASEPSSLKKRAPDEKISTTSSGKWMRVLRSRRILRKH